MARPLIPLSDIPVIDAGDGLIHDAHSFATDSDGSDAGDIIAHENVHVVQGGVSHDAIESSDGDVVEAEGSYGREDDLRPGRPVPAQVQAVQQAAAQNQAQATTTADPAAVDQDATLPPPRDYVEVDPSPPASTTVEETADGNPYLIKDDPPDPAAEPTADDGGDVSE